jgi:hypothetical protein
MSASCQSLTSQLIKVAGDFLEKYQDFRKEAAKVFVDTIIPGKGDSSGALDNLIDQAIDLQTDFLKSYGVVVGEGKGAIGPRHQVIPTKKVTGEDLLTERTFITAKSPFDKVTVVIKKTGGKAGADICVCAKYANGSIFNEKRKSIEKGDDSKGDSVQFVFDDMYDKILTIHLVQDGFITNSMDYNLSLEGEFNEKEMEATDKSSSKAGVH